MVAVADRIPYPGSCRIRVHGHSQLWGALVGYIFIVPAPCARVCRCLVQSHGWMRPSTQIGQFILPSAAVWALSLMSTKGAPYHVSHNCLQAVHNSPWRLGGRCGLGSTPAAQVLLLPVRLRAAAALERGRVASEGPAARDAVGIRPALEAGAAAGRAGHEGDQCRGRGQGSGAACLGFLGGV